MAIAPAALLLWLLAPFSAGSAAGIRPSVSLDKTPEPATCTVIGGALCLVSLRLRRRKR